MQKETVRVLQDRQHNKTLHRVLQAWAGRVRTSPLPGGVLCKPDVSAMGVCQPVRSCSTVLQHCCERIHQ